MWNIINQMLALSYVFICFIRDCFCWFFVISNFQNFGSRTDTVFCGVFDGHGPYGHMVAKKVRDSLPLKLSTNWEVDTKDDAVNAAPTGNQFEVFDTLKDSFINAFKVMDKELKINSDLDCFCSGTTAVTLVKQVMK